MADQCYFNGNFYQCVLPTVAGESPVTAPMKWQVVAIPARWRWLLKKLTYAGLLDMDGQKDKANDEHDRAMNTERMGLECVVRNEANREGFLERPLVRLRQ